jgi:hypothetical protein
VTGTEFLTGVLRWFLFQNGNFQKVAETAADHKTHCRQPIWFNAAIVVRCDYLIRSALIADTMLVRKSSTWAKSPRKNKVYREIKRTEKSVFLLKVLEPFTTKYTKDTKEKSKKQKRSTMTKYPCHLVRPKKNLGMCGAQRSRKYGIHEKIFK